MKTVILTGLIGSGKSAVSALLRKRGIPVYDSDSRTKQLYARRPSLVRRLEEALGVPIRTEEGKLDRTRLAGVIFSDDSARETVESIVYPAVLQDFIRWRERQGRVPFVVLESAVILSKPVFDGVGDAVVLVTASEELRLRRVMARDGADEARVRSRMAAQEIPMDRVQVVLENNGSPASLSEAVERVFFDKNAYICKFLKDEQ